MSLKTIKGIGDKTEALYNKLNIYNPQDLITFFPVAYSIYDKPCTLDEVDNRLTVSVEAVVIKLGTIKNIKNLKILTSTLKDNNGKIFKATWFNMPYLRNTLKTCNSYIFRGKVKKTNNLKNPEISLEQPEVFSKEAYMKKMNEMQPVYRKTEGLTNNNIIKAIHNIIDDMDNPDYNLDIVDVIPDYYKKKYNFLEYRDAIRKIHFPKNYSELEEARKRLAYEEFLLYILALKRFKEHDDFIENNYVISLHEETISFINKLPFKLTQAQQTAFEDICNDMKSHKLMNRLVQGDVGCGKTILAILALINTGFAGFQGTLMAPTEVLARQHYLNILDMFEKYNINLTPVLLTGSMTGKQKKDVKEMIENGQAQIIIGTHAIIQDNVSFNNLALVITDEQHRFGVKQREKLSEKGKSPHILVMSATPIPRTLAIIIYGDLDISVINTLPTNRLPIKNCVVGKEYREKAYKFIEKEVLKGRQAYVICPMADESEMTESEDVISYCELLKTKLDSSINIEYLHGKLKASVKNQIMEDFSNGKIDVLVSTTVIEVGINVPNATVIMIENAERFGLAGLHQIRGRVGRGKEQSYCIFVCTTKKKESIEKLKILEKSNDGFFISSEDLRLRGPGDLFGIRQSGEFEFKIGDVFNDAHILKAASDDEKNITVNTTSKEYETINSKASVLAKTYLNLVNL